MEKRHLDRRLDQMRAEGTSFVTSTNVGGPDGPSVESLRASFGAIVLAGGATAWRDLPIPGRQFTGIYQAMEFLPPSNHVQPGHLPNHPSSPEPPHLFITAPP